MVLVRTTSQLQTSAEEEATKSEKHHPVDVEIPDDWVSKLSEDFKGLNFEEKLDKIADFLDDKIKYADTSDYYMSVSDIIKNGVGDCNAISDVAAALLRRLGIPARVVGGYHFSEKSVGGHAWVEAQNPEIKKWYLLEPQSGHSVLKNSSFKFMKLFSGPTFGDFRKSYKVPHGLQSVLLSEKEYDKILKEKGYKTPPEIAPSQGSEHLNSEDD
jgi:transglutaminase-like putative cysteine protease